MEKVERQLERENHSKHAWNASEWDAFGNSVEEVAPDETGGGCDRIQGW